MRWLWGIIREYVKNELVDLVLGHPYAWAGALILGAITSALAWFQAAPIFAALAMFCFVAIAFLFAAIVWYGPTRQPTNRTVGGRESVSVAAPSIAMPTPMGLFYDEHDPNCYQPDGRVFKPIVGEGSVEYDETIYRLGVRSENQIQGCRVVLADVEPRPHDPGQQRIGLPMKPRIPASTGSEEFTVNRNASAFVEVLREVKQRVNPLNQSSLIQLIYFNEDHGRANYFENGDYILTFRLEGPMTPIPYRLSVKFDGRRQQRRWRVGPA